MSRIDSQVSAVQFRLTLSILVEWLAVAAFALASGTLLLVIVERLFHFGIPPMTFWMGLGLVGIIAIVMTQVSDFMWSGGLVEFDKLVAAV